MKVTRLGMALLLGGALLISGACSSGDDDDDNGGSGEESADPTRTPRPPRETPTAEPQAAPTFEPGPWTSGEATAAVSGGAEATLTATLLPQSSSEERTTRLVYGDGLDTILLSISVEFQPFDMSFRKGSV